MSKRNLNMGTASGKLGDIVYYRRKGQQASRVYRGTVANPQTDLQMDTRVVFRNGQTWYQLMKQTPLDLLGLRSKYGDYYSQIMRLGIRYNIPIAKQAATAGYSVPFPIGQVRLAPTQKRAPYLNEQLLSSKYAYTIVLGLQGQNSTTPTTIAGLLSWLQVYNPWLQSGDHLALWAGIQNVPNDSDIDYQNESAQSHLYFSDVELSTDDTRRWEVAMPNWVIDLNAPSSGQYLVGFRCSQLLQWSSANVQGQVAVLTCVLWRPIKNGGKRILFRFAKANDALEIWQQESHESQAWRDLADSYKRGSY